MHLLYALVVIFCIPLLFNRDELHAEQREVFGLNLTVDAIEELEGGLLKVQLQDDERILSEQQLDDFLIRKLFENKLWFEGFQAEGIAQFTQKAFEAKRYDWAREGMIGLLLHPELKAELARPLAQDVSKTSKNASVIADALRVVNKREWDPGPEQIKFFVHFAVQKPAWSKSFLLKEAFQKVEKVQSELNALLKESLEAEDLKKFSRISQTWVALYGESKDEVQTQQKILLFVQDYLRRDPQEAVLVLDFLGRLIESSAYADKLLADYLPQQSLRLSERLKFFLRMQEQMKILQIFF